MARRPQLKQPKFTLKELELIHSTFKRLGGISITHTLVIFKAWSTAKAMKQLGEQSEMEVNNDD